MGIQRKQIIENRKGELKMEIKKIMERETALERINEIKNKIGEVDLDSICEEETSVIGGNEAVYKKFVQAVMCGLVFWDDEKNCLVQTLINPVKAGELHREALYYQKHLTLGQMKRFKEDKEMGVAIEAIATVTACPVPLIEQIQGQDQKIASACVDFFS